MNEINLVGVGPKKYDEKKLRFARIVAILALFLTGFLSIGLFLLNTRFSVANVKRQQTDVINQISSYDKRVAKIAVVNQRVLEIKQIRGQNIDYTQFIQIILEMLPQELNIATLDIEEKNVGLSVSSSSLLPMSDFINKLLKFASENSKDNPTVSKVTIESISANANAGNFFMTINIEMP